MDRKTIVDRRMHTTHYGSDVSFEAHKVAVWISPVLERIDDESVHESVSSKDSSPFGCSQHVELPQGEVRESEAATMVSVQQNQDILILSKRADSGIGLRDGPDNASRLPNYDLSQCRGPLQNLQDSDCDIGMNPFVATSTGTDRCNLTLDDDGRFVDKDIIGGNLVHSSPAWNHGGNCQGNEGAKGRSSHAGKPATSMSCLRCGCRIHRERDHEPERGKAERRDART